MSKATIKQLLQSMTKKDIIEMVLDLYSARKEAKEYLDFYACPDEKGKLEEYKSIIREEFYPSKRREPKTRFSVCRKAVSDFKKLKPSDDALQNSWYPIWNGRLSSHTITETCGSNTMIPWKAILKRLSSMSLPTVFGRSISHD